MSTTKPSNERLLTVLAETVAEVMAANPATVPADRPVSEAARRMAENAIGSVVVLDEGGELLGICTDRDIAVRVIALNRGPDTPVREACTVAVGRVPHDLLGSAERRRCGFLSISGVQR